MSPLLRPRRLSCVVCGVEGPRKAFEPTTGGPVCPEACAALWARWNTRERWTSLLSRYLGRDIETIDTGGRT